MRTKHILTALVFPALFAACTADEFNDSITNGSTAERAQLSENFKLNFDGADTRFSAGDPDESLYFTYEVGDTIGGAIADQYFGGDRYEVVNYISTNHPFVRNAAGEWVINHTMVEGNYLFYFPYNENNHSRGAVHYSIPVLQDLTGEDGKFNPKAAVEKYNMGVGLQFLDKEDLSASLTLANIYGYAKLQLKLDNTYAGGEVDKIVLQDNGRGFALNGQISNKKVASLFKSSDPDALKNATTTAVFSIASGESFYDATLNNTSSVMVAKVPAGTTLKADAQNNKTFETYIVMPAATDYDVNVYLYMADGSVYEAENVTFDVLRNKIKTVSENLVHAENAPYVVTSEKDWNEYVALLSKDDKAEFIIAGDDFSITNDIKYPTNGATITIEGEVKVSGDDVTMKNVTAEKIVIEEGAKLTTDATLHVCKWTSSNRYVRGEVYNYGKLVVAKAEVEGKTVVYGKDIIGLCNVYNMPGATLVVDKDAQAQFTLYNQIENKEALNHGTVEINGMLTLNNSSVNSGVITNNGSLRGSFTNKEEVVYPQGASGDKIKNSFMPTIVNNNEIFATGVVTNKGLVENNKNAEISCSKVGGSAQFNNEGTIELANGSRMLITSNANGEVILETLNQGDWSIEGTQGIVAYSTTASDAGKSYDFASVGKGITKLYVNGSLGIQKIGNVEAIEIAENATLSLAKDLYLNGTLTVKEGADVVIATTKATVSELQVEKGATVTINKDNELVATAVSNEGTVYVGGQFSTSTPEGEAGKGEFRSTSADGDNIQFGQTQDEIDQEKKEQAFEDALTTLVTGWVNNSGHSTGWATATVAGMLNTSNWSNATWSEPAKFVEAYNALYALSITEADINTVLPDFATQVNAIVTSLKSSAKTDAKTAVSTVVAANKVGLGWKGGYGNAFIGKINTGLQQMWNTYVDYLQADAQAGIWDAKYKNATGKLNKSLVFALDDILTDANLSDLTKATMPDLAIPTGAYLNAPTDSDNYLAVKAWMDNNAFEANSNTVATDISTGGTNYFYSNDDSVTRTNIQNWYVKANATEVASIEAVKAKQAASKYLDVVIEWEEPVYSDANLKALVNLINE